MRFKLRVVALALFSACQGQAVALELSSPRGGDDTLHCDAYASKPFGKPPNPEDFLGWLRKASDFATARRSEETDREPHGFVDIGLNGQDYRLAAKPGADLLRGGFFEGSKGTHTTLKVTVDSMAFFHDAHEEEESAVASQATFEIVQGRETLKFTGAVVCSVYELHYFHKAVCEGRGTSGDVLCQALAKALAHPSRDKLVPAR